jgi:hypothetical protein
MSCYTSCATPQDYKNGWVFFGPGAEAPESHHFEVASDPIILTATGLQPGQCARLELVFGCGAGDDFIPYMLGCQQVSLCASAPSALIAESGRYRMVLTGGAEQDPESITVYGRPQRVAPGYGGEAMSCCNCGPVADWTVNTGGTLINGTLVNPVVSGGAINAATLTGVIIGVACDGTPIYSGSPLLRCGDIPEVTLPTTLPPSGPAGGDLAGTYPNPTFRIGAKLGESCSGADVNVGDTFVTCADLTAGLADTLADAIAYTDGQLVQKQGALVTCAGAPLAAGAAVPTCVEMNTAIAAAIASVVDTDDQTAAEVPIADAANNFTATDVEGALAELAAAIAGVVDTDDQTAAEVPIADAANYFTATDVEGALAELGAASHAPATITSTNLTVGAVGQAFTVDAPAATGAVAGIAPLATVAAYVPTNDAAGVTPAALEARLATIVPTIPPVVLAERTGTQTLAAATWTKGNFPIEIEDSEAVYNPATSRFTFTRSGIYYFSAQSSFGSGTDLPTTGIRVYKNGAFTLIGSQSTAEGSGTVQIASGMIKINAGDYIEIFLYKGSNIAGDYNAIYGAVQSFYIRPL